jgi:hypothetical protein
VFHRACKFNLQRSVAIAGRQDGDLSLGGNYRRGSSISECFITASAVGFGCACQLINNQTNGRSGVSGSSGLVDGVRTLADIVMKTLKLSIAIFHVRAMYSEPGLLHSYKSVANFEEHITF